MFRSLGSSIFTFLSVLLFAFVLVLIWNGSSGIQFQRIAMEGDRSTAELVAEYRAKQAEEAELARRGQDNELTTTMTDPEPSDGGSGEGPAVVLWLSIPGFRGDYVQNADTSTFDEFISEGAATNKMRPHFPCVTFPSHVTTATGAPVSAHGIVADKIRLEDGTLVENPADPALLKAEPIWTTATRQEIPTLVHDWPLSWNQEGEHAAAAFLNEYNAEETDQARLEKALEAWRKGPGGEGDDAKFRLVMLRLDDIYRAGLVNGPREQPTYDAVTATDKAIGEFLETVRSEWNQLAPPDANLVVLVTTDHGMAELDKNVNLAQLLGEEMMKNCDVIAHDAVANLYFKDLPENEGESKLFTDAFDDELKKRIYFRTYTREELPEEWSYLHEGRVGDRILVLKGGYGFTEMEASEPVFDPSEGPGFFGGYGYPVKESIRMSGQIMITGYPNPPTTGDLDEISQLVFHATVCKILGIEPAETASKEGLDVR